MELASCSPGSQQQVVRTVSSSVIWQTADGPGLYYSRPTMTCHQPHTSWVSYAFGLPTASQLLGVAIRGDRWGEASLITSETDNVRDITAWAYVGRYNISGGNISTNPTTSMNHDIEVTDCPGQPANLAA